MGVFLNSPSVSKGAGRTFHRQTGDVPRRQYRTDTSPQALPLTPCFCSFSQTPFPEPCIGELQSANRGSNGSQEISHLPLGARWGDLSLSLHSIKGLGFNNHKGAPCVGSIEIESWKGWVLATQSWHCQSPRGLEFKTLNPPAGQLGQRGLTLR